jgi:hypothetical protein
MEPYLHYQYAFMAWLLIKYLTFHFINYLSYCYLLSYDTMYSGYHRLREIYCLHF